VEYCQGARKKAPWGVSTADFHSDSRLGLKLGAFPTVFLVKEFSRGGILEALEAGRMYCARGDGTHWPKLDFFYASGDKAKKAFMGGTLRTSRPPIIMFRVSSDTEPPVQTKMRLIRGGHLIQTFESRLPMEVEFKDKDCPKGKKTYYRVMDARNHLTSNPIFVTYQPK
jgi:hypothetical protein